MHAALFMGMLHGLASGDEELQPLAGLEVVRHSSTQELTSWPYLHRLARLMLISAGTRSGHVRFGQYVCGFGTLKWRVRHLHYVISRHGRRYRLSASKNLPNR
jgi:hypothetical protein